MSCGTCPATGMTDSTGDGMIARIVMAASPVGKGIPAGRGSVTVRTARSERGKMTGTAIRRCPAGDRVRACCCYVVTATAVCRRGTSGSMECPRVGKGVGSPGCYVNLTVNVLGNINKAVIGSVDMFMANGTGSGSSHVRVRTVRGWESVAGATTLQIPRLPPSWRLIAPADK